MKRSKTVKSIGLYAIRCFRHRNGIIVEIKKDKYGFYWEEDWQLARPENEEKFECWKLE